MSKFDDKYLQLMEAFKLPSSKDMAKLLTGRFGKSMYFEPFNIKLEDYLYYNNEGLPTGFKEELRDFLISKISGDYELKDTNYGWDPDYKEYRNLSIDGKGSKGKEKSYPSIWMSLPKYSHGNQHVVKITVYYYSKSYTPLATQTLAIQTDNNFTEKTINDLLTKVAGKATKEKELRIYGR